MSKMKSSITRKANRLLTRRMENILHLIEVAAAVHDLGEAVEATGSENIERVFDREMEHLTSAAYRVVESNEEINKWDLELSVEKAA